jgi:hypothetical protein
MEIFMTLNEILTRSSRICVSVLTGLLLITGIQACAVTTVPEWHSFEFDAVFEMNDIEIVDFRYGNGPAFPIRTRCMPVSEREDKCLQGTSANLLTEIGETLWVKWKIKSSGLVFEDTIEIKKLLPKSINGMTIFFIIRDKQLSLYLNTFQPRPPVWPVYPGVRKSGKIYQLYPTSNLDK